MLFNSYIFIFVFLPLTLGSYYGLHKLGKPVFAKIALILMSFWFYGYFNPNYLWIMCSSIIVNYLLSQLLQRKWEMSAAQIAVLKKSLLAIGLIFNLGLIFYFKYYDFFVDNLNKVFSTDFQLKNIVLPLGISFFTFQQVSYMVDSYRGETKEYNFADYALFVTFFPQLIAGPIVLHNEVLPQFEDKNNWKINWDNMAHGLYMFAAGLGYMFNIQIPMNFNSPYKALSIIDFWKRWHLTLTRFLRTYVYFPLGGSRRGTVRTYINIITVFLVSGLWHGANWTFIFWGFLHGIGNALTRMFKKQWESMHEVMQWAVTFLFVNVTWIFFRADSISQAFAFIKRILGFKNLNVRAPFLQTFQLKEFHLIYSHIPVLNKIMASIRGVDALVLLAGLFFLCLNFKNNQEMKFRPTAKLAVLTVFCLVWGIFTLSGVSEFLYFNF